MSGELNNIKEVWVMDKTYNWYRRTYAHIFPIVPKAKVKYEVISRYSSGNIKILEPKEGIGQYFLYKHKRFNVANSLAELGLNPSDFIEPVTVHHAHKIQKWQGIVFTSMPEIWKECNCDGTKHYHIIRSCGYDIELPTYNMSDHEAIKWLKLVGHIKIVYEK
jgi:hypothetical protein